MKLISLIRDAWMKTVSVEFGTSNVAAMIAELLF